jgi:hypothetical protein
MFQFSEMTTGGLQALAELFMKSGNKQVMPGVGKGANTLC